MAKITFEMPRGDAEFDDLDNGEKMKVTCTIQKEGQDKACLVAVGGKTLPGYSEKDDNADEESSEGENDNEPNMMDAMDEQMG